MREGCEDAGDREQVIRYQVNREKSMRMTDKKQWGRLLMVVLLLTILISACTTSENFYAELPSNESGVAETEENLNVLDSESNLILIEEAIIGLLLLAAIVGIFTKRLRVPYTVGLVLIGLVLSTQGQIDFDVTPELFLALLVPPLLYVLNGHAYGAAASECCRSELQSEQAASPSRI